MNLLIISPSFYPAKYYGGPIFSLYNLSKCLARNDIKVFVTTTNCNGKQKLNIKKNKYIELEKNIFVKYYGNGTPRGFSIWMYTLLWKDLFRKDIIYLVSIFSPPTPLVLFLNIFFRKPLILSPRGQLGEWYLNQGNILKKLYLIVIINPIANKIIWEATSLPEKKMIQKVYPKAKVEVIPSIINVEEFANGNEDDKLEARGTANNYALYEKLTGKSSECKKIIVSMGRLHKVKGFDILIEAFAILIKQKPDCILLIAGKDFGEQKNLEQLIEKIKLRDKVFLVGNIEGKAKMEFLQNADLFALTSHHENFGIVYAEALASGTPVVASKNTPWQDVEKYDCGKWVNNTPDDFAKAMADLLNVNLIEKGENGRKYISEHFSCNAALKKYRALFNTILNK